ncbi:MAG: aldo/keto reductase [Odoribacter sp.]
MKLVLGTVQFGMNYGIASQGRPCTSCVKNILQLAYADGINILDTSAGYGDAENILGKVLNEIDSPFKIISKYPKSDVSVKDTFFKTLEHLQVAKLYGYLLHHFEVYRENPDVWKEFLRLKEEGKVLKIGFSLYSPSELEILLAADVPFDLVQFPYNIFDRQFEPYFKLLKRRGVEIHVRSTFLQGLFFKDRNHLPEKLIPLRPYLEELDCYAKMQGMTVAEVALNYNLQNPYIDGVLIGVDTTEQLNDNVRSISDKKVELAVNVNEKELLNPVNWK